MKYICKSCKNLFESDDEFPYCRICGWEDLEEVPFNDDKYINLFEAVGFKIIKKDYIIDDHVKHVILLFRKGELDADGE